MSFICEYLGDFLAIVTNTFKLSPFLVLPVTILKGGVGGEGTGVGCQSLPLPVPRIKRTKLVRFMSFVLARGLLGPDESYYRSVFLIKQSFTNLLITV